MKGLSGQSDQSEQVSKKKVKLWDLYVDPQTSEKKTSFNLKTALAALYLPLVTHSLTHSLDDCHFVTSDKWTLTTFTVTTLTTLTTFTILITLTLP